MLSREGNIYQLCAVYIHMALFKVPQTRGFLGNWTGVWARQEVVSLVLGTMLWTLLYKLRTE